MESSPIEAMFRRYCWCLLSLLSTSHLSLSFQVNRDGSLDLHSLSTLPLANQRPSECSIISVGRQP